MRTDRISAQTIYNVLAKRCLQTAQATIKPHDLRRSFATHLFEKGEDALTVGRLMGHTSVNTTKAYDMRDEKAARAAADRLTLKEKKND